MKPAAERQAEFLADFRALMRKHGAEFNVEDRSIGNWNTEGTAYVEMNAIYEGDVCVAEFACFDLPRWNTGKEPTK